MSKTLDAKNVTRATMYTAAADPSAAGEDLIFNWLFSCGGLLKFVYKNGRKDSDESKSVGGRGQVEHK